MLDEGPIESAGRPHIDSLRWLRQYLLRHGAGNPRSRPTDRVTRAHPLVVDAIGTLTGRWRAREYYGLRSPSKDGVAPTTRRLPRRSDDLFRAENMRGRRDFATRVRGLLTGTDLGPSTADDPAHLRATAHIGEWIRPGQNEIRGLQLTR